MRFILLACALASCASPSRRSNTTLIDVEGWAVIERGDWAGARRRALAEAQRKAVEQAVGLDLLAESRVEKAVNTNQRIHLRSGGTIASYRVVAETIENGFLKTRIRALVSKSPPSPSMKAAVAIMEQPLGDIMRLVVGRKGFSLDPATSADIVIRGSASVHALNDARLGRFCSYRARVSLSVLGASSGVLLLETGTASAADLEDRAARASAIEKAGELAWNNALTRLNVMTANRYAARTYNHTQ
jgi:hypothetical protein